MPAGPSPGIERAAQAITAYLLRHPDAADTEAGITQWWIPAELGTPLPQTDVHAALGQLVQAKHLQACGLPDGEVIYRTPLPRPSG